MMFEQTYNFLQLSENLFTAGMPTAEQLSDASKHGVQVVINLAPHDSENALENEAELVTALGMKYINIPVLWSAPTKENLDKFMDKMDENRGKVVFVHCEANYRASAFVAIYRMSRLGWKEENAFASVRKIWGDDDYPVWKVFIETAVRKIS